MPLCGWRSRSVKLVEEVERPSKRLEGGASGRRLESLHTRRIFADCLMGTKSCLRGAASSPSARADAEHRRVAKSTTIVPQEGSGPSLQRGSTRSYLTVSEPRARPRRWSAGGACSRYRIRDSPVLMWGACGSSPAVYPQLVLRPVSLAGMAHPRVTMLRFRSFADGAGVFRFRWMSCLASPPRWQPTQPANRPGSLSRGERRLERRVPESINVTTRATDFYYRPRLDVAPVSTLVRLPLTSGSTLSGVSSFSRHC